ncbi:MAG: hypothetical protein HYV03_08645 [Deltaproteobacteria bacterium]|nr:hypothetical protein [Deltaproteobacteria bacterium]
MQRQKSKWHGVALVGITFALFGCGGGGGEEGAVEPVAIISTSPLSDEGLTVAQSAISGSSFVKQWSSNTTKSAADIVEGQLVDIINRIVIDRVFESRQPDPTTISKVTFNDGETTSETIFTKAEDVFPMGEGTIALDGTIRINWSADKANATLNGTITTYLNDAGFTVEPITSDGMKVYHESLTGNFSTTFSGTAEGLTRNEGGYLTGGESKATISMAGNGIAVTGDVTGEIVTLAPVFTIVDNFADTEHGTNSCSGYVTVRVGGNLETCKLEWNYRCKCQ